MKSEFNQTSLTIWKLMQLQAQSDVKTPLGLISLMINLNHNHEFTLQTQSTKEAEMEF